MNTPTPFELASIALALQKAATFGDEQPTGDFFEPALQLLELAAEFIEKEVEA